jgi:hypothetical protein
MSKTGTLLLIVSLLYFSCSESGGTSERTNIEKGDSIQFFQLKQYIESEIQEIDKTPFYIYKIEVTNGKKDSTAINTAVLKALSAPFAYADISKPSIKKNYKESVFHDQSTESYTISYSAITPDLEVQNIDVLLKEDGQTVKRLFIRKFINYGDSTAMEQLSWKAGESFRINRLVQMPNKSEIERQTVVVWNAKS